MSGGRLFLRRLLQDIQEQSKSIRSILDWSVLLYIVIPSLIVLPFFYRDAWKNIHLYWDSDIPFIFLSSLILLAVSRGNIRTYIREADLIYLLQEKSLLLKLKGYALFYSLVLAFLHILLTVLITLPVLTLIYAMNYYDILNLFFIIGAYKVIILTVKKVVNKPVWKWALISIIFLGCILIIKLIHLYIYGIMGVLLLFIFILIHLNILKTNRWLLKEINDEYRERTKYTYFILNYSLELEKKSHNYRKKPGVLFKRSSRIFKKRSRENGVLELQLKSFIRDKNYVISYLQLIGITCFAIIIVPLWAKIIVYVCFIFFIRYWAKIICRRMLMDNFFQVVPLEKTELGMVEAEFKKWISYPVHIITGVIVLYFYLIALLHCV